MNLVEVWFRAVSASNGVTRAAMRTSSIFT